MDYREFRNGLSDFSFFTLNDIKKLRGKVYQHRLNEWQRLGYIERIGNGVYKFSSVKMDEFRLFYVANLLYSPSYISLETALSFYGFIPEAVYSITSVSSKKTQSFQTRYASLSYKKIKSSLFWGYRLMERDNFVIKFAEPEKAVLDYFYLNSHLSTADHIDELRINYIEFNEKINRDILMRYLEFFSNKRLNKRIELLLDSIDSNQKAEG
jgi:predicted transcriptional regulator of viral defense system